METNLYIFNFIKGNFLLLLIIFLFLVKIIPSEWAGFWKYNNNKEEDGRAPRITLLKLFFHNAIEAIWGTMIINLIALLRDTVISFIIFGALGFDIFYHHQISREAIILVCVGVIIMYLETLIKTGSYLRLFGGMLEWKKDVYSQQLKSPTEKPKTNKVIKKFNSTKEEKIV